MDTKSVVCFPRIMYNTFYHLFQLTFYIPNLHISYEAEGKSARIKLCVMGSPLYIVAHDQLRRKRQFNRR